MAILFRDRQVIASVKDFLCAHSTDFYTTMRLSGRNGQVLEFEMHLMRVKANNSERELIEKMLKEIYNEISDKGKDLRITLIRRSNQTDPFDLIYEEMTPMNMESCQVEIRFGQRSNVQEKSSQWVKDRRELEDLKSPESNEIILSDQSGRLFEGLSSNFFIIRQDGRIQTSPLCDVLPGTVMKRVLQRCESEGEEVVFEHPKIGEADSWKGAFITSTSRLILPIDKVIVYDRTGKPQFIKTIPLNDKIMKMRKELQSEII